MKYNLIIADDHKLFLEGITNLIESQTNLNLVLTAASGASVIKYLQINDKEKIDLIISDISMPDVDGIELNRFLKTNFPDTKVLIVSMHTDPNILDNLIKNNVDGYLSKNTASDEFITAIETILKGQKYFSEQVKTQYTNSVFNNQKEAIELLTTREKEVLKLIAQEFTTQEIADKLFLSKHTIESYRKSLISKLKVRNLAGLTKYAIKFGLVE